ncbi:MAG: hypothetical protein LBC59_03800 [Chitinispirillales bacterium]|nr:hypothetical protein [Chitinispirillales bacterium]
MNFDDEIRESDDKVCEHERIKDTNDNIIDPTNNILKKFGSNVRIEREDYNSREHLLDEITADKFRNTSMSTAEAQVKILDKLGGARAMMEIWEKKLGLVGSGNSEEEWKRFFARKREHDKIVAPKRKFWITFSTLLGGIIGLLLLGGNISTWAGTGVVVATTGAIALGIVCLIRGLSGEYTEYNYKGGCSQPIKSCCAWSLGTWIALMIFLKIAEAAIDSNILDNTIVPTIVVVVCGAVIGFFMGRTICDMVYEFGHWGETTARKSYQRERKVKEKREARETRKWPEEWKRLYPDEYKAKQEKEQSDEEWKRLYPDKYKAKQEAEQQSKKWARQRKLCIILGSLSGGVIGGICGWKFLDDSVYIPITAIVFALVLGIGVGRRKFDLGCGGVCGFGCGGVIVGAMIAAAAAALGDALYGGTASVAVGAVNGALVGYVIGDVIDSKIY